jgi:hypothetical protein
MSSTMIHEMSKKGTDYENGVKRNRYEALLKPGSETVVEYLLTVPEFQRDRALSLGAVETSRGWRFSGVQRAAWFRGEGV